MSYIKFDKQQLVNLEYSLTKELLRTNRAGSYASTTLPGCNTRKYHGLMVSLQPQIDNQHHVLLSSLDVTIIQRNAEFNLAIHKYGDNVYEPGGHKYISDFESDPIPKLTYRVGGVILNVERLFDEENDRIMIRYHLVDAHSPTTLRFRPLLAFRNVHDLSRKNDYANTTYSNVENGISMKMYDLYSSLFMQFSDKVNFISDPNWYFGIEYTKEKTRGYDFKEDLFNPGYFEIQVKKNEKLIFSAGLIQIDPGDLHSAFKRELKNRVPRDSFKNCLLNAAEQFFVQDNGNVDLIAGYHWFIESGRDTFVALPGLTLNHGKQELFLKVVNTIINKMKGPFFPNNRIGKDYIYNSVDAPLWFFWSLQQFILNTGKGKLIWDKYGIVMKLILDEFSKGTTYGIRMLETGLLTAGEENDVLTWMNVLVDNKPVTNRNGLAVDVNALWYNAICFYAELAKKFRKPAEAKKWNEVAGKIKEHFTNVFWNKEKGYMADVVRGDYKDFSVRPNMVLLTSMPYSPVSDDQKHGILQTIEKQLLTPRGLRSLSPRNPNYKGIYKGNITERDLAYHQGAAFPWLFGHFAEGYIKLYGEEGKLLIERIYKGFEETMVEHGIGTISELYNGDPPHTAKGAISQAWSIAELLRISNMLNK
ncbi:MAG: glycogen debranching enzyme family protein [Bacteroidales bacterium]|nr:glycogen debranching enzyme family protein [Bacteroidales bacterium]